MNKEEIKDRIYSIPDGVPLNLGRMTIKTSKTDKLLVIGWTNTFHFENISKKTVTRELQELKDVFSELSESYPEIKSIIQSNNLTVEYHITYNDAGKAGIGLCSEIGGNLTWYINE